eukprot:2446058-Rhodomonas_salina.1
MQYGTTATVVTSKTAPNSTSPAMQTDHAAAETSPFYMRPTISISTPLTFLFAHRPRTHPPACTSSPTHRASLTRACPRQPHKRSVSSGSDAVCVCVCAQAFNLVPSAASLLPLSLSLSP